MNKVVRKYLFNEEHPLRVKGRQNILATQVVEICGHLLTWKCIEKREEKKTTSIKTNLKCLDIFHESIYSKSFSAYS